MRKFSPLAKLVLYLFLIFGWTFANAACPTVPGTTTGTATHCEDSNTGDITLIGNNGVVVNWQYSTNGGTSYIDLLDQTGSTMYTYTNLAAGTYLFRAKVQEGACAIDYSTATTVTINPNPVASFEVDDVCFGSTSIFRNNTTLASGNMTYAWDFGDGVGNSTNTNPQYQFTAANTYLVSLTAITSLGCSTTVNQAVDVFEVPVADYTIADATTCEYDSVGFTSTSTLNGTTVTYDWNFGDATSNSALENPNHKYTAGVYNVSLLLTTTDGCTASKSSTIRVYPKPVANFSVSDVCQDFASNFINNSSISSGTLSYNWSFGDLGTSTSQSPSHTYGSYGIPFNVTLIVSSEVACTDTAEATTVVNPKPAADFTLLENCAGSPSGFSDNSLVAAGSIISYNYNFGDGSSAINANPSKTYATTGSYTVNLFIETDKGCKDTSTQTINVTKVDNPLYTNGKLTGSATVCEGTNGGTIVLNGTTGAIVRWQKSENNGVSWINIPNTALTLSYTNLDTTTLYRVETQKAACYTEYSDTATITVAANPSASFTNTTVCLNSTTGFTSTSTSSNGNITNYEWEFGDGSSSTSSAPNRLYSTAGTYTTTLIITTQYGCKDTASSSITVNPNPVSDFTFTNACLNLPSTFTDNSSIASGSIQSYAWNFGDGNSDNVQNTSNTYASEGTYSVTLTTTSDNGCTNAISKSISVYERPSLSFQHTAVCKGANTSFTNTSNISSGNPTYVWNFGDGNNSSVNNPTHIYSAEGTYNVVLTSTTGSGCIDSTTEVITVYAQPSADYTTASVCSYDSLSLTDATSLNNATISSYAWDFGDGNTSTFQNVKHLYTSPGTYQISFAITSTNGCTSSKTKSIIIYPVPTANYSVTNACDTLPVSFTNNSIISSGTLSYNWSFGDGNTSTSLNPTNTYNADGTYNTRLIVTSNFGCVDTLDNIATVFPRPQVAYTLNETCVGSPNGFTNNTTINSGSVASYIWNFGDGGSSMQTNPSKVFASVGDYWVTLTATSDKGCTETFGDSVNVTKVADANNTRGIMLGDATVCFGTNSGSLYLSGSTGTILKWQYSEDNGANWSDLTNTSATYNFSNLNTTTLYRVETQITSCATAFSDTLTIVVKPLPVASFSNTTVCYGQTTAFTNTSTALNGTINSFNWDLGNGFGSNLQNPTVDYSADGTYNVTLIVSTADGCRDTTTGIITVNPLPVVNFSASEVCSGTVTTFTNSSSISSGSIIGNSWNFGDNNTSTQTNPTNTYSTHGDYTVKLIATSALGCKDSVSKTITVNPNPVADYSFNTVCLGNSTEFTNNSSIVYGNISYSWNFGNGTNTSNTNPNHSYSSAGTYNALLTVTSLKGCVDTISKQIAVYAQPTANFTFSNVCSYDSAAFLDASVTGGTALSYAWDFGDGFNSFAQSPNHKFPGPGTYVIKQVVTTGANCSSSATKTISIYPVPNVEFSADAVCLNDSTVFNNNTTILSGNLIYLWNLGDGANSSVSEPTHLYSSNGVYTAKLIATSVYGCADTISHNVTVNALPQVDFIANTVCDGNTTTFNNSSSISNGTITSYVWDFGDGTNSIVINPDKQFMNSGSYSVNLIAESNKGCKASVTKTVTVYDRPIASFTANSECINKSITFSNASSVVSGTLTYYWDFDNGDTTSVLSPSYTYSVAGLYNVMLKATSDLGCSDSTYLEIEAYGNPAVNAGLDTSVSQGYSTALTATGGVQYVWFPTEGLDNSSSATPLATPFQTTNYTVTVIDQYGCVATDEVKVSVTEDFKVVATNVFTPNGDGVNDYWLVDNIETFGQCNVNIYDRSGQEVFTAAPYKNNWDGTFGTDILPDGTYYYVITFSNSDKVYKGAITLLRNKQ